MEHEQVLREFTLRSAEKIGVTLNDAHLDQFMFYLDHLLEWNKTINLTAITDQREIVVKHFIDSLGALTATLFPLNAVVLDVGSGAGFPGLPLKIVRNDLRLVLIEPVQKKCSFLRSMVGLFRFRDVTVFEGTVEQYAESSMHSYADVVLLRAIRFPDISNSITRLLRSKGKIVLYRTEPLKQGEIDPSLSLRLTSELRFDLPDGYGDRVISVTEVH